MAQPVWTACYTGLSVLMEKRNTDFCTEQGWEGFPVASPLAAVVSGARTEAEGEILFSCSVLLLGLSVRKLSLKHRLASRQAREGRGGLYRRKEQQNGKGPTSGAQDLRSLEYFSEDFLACASSPVTVPPWSV